MKKRVISIFFLLIMAVTCLAVGIAGCSNDSSKAGRIIIRTDSTEQVVSVGTNYTTPIAGVFDENEDRINGRTIITSVYNPANRLLEESSEQIKFRFMSKGVWKIVYSSYVGNEKDTLTPDATITVYACSVLTTPKNFSVANNTLTWDKVENASGYEVTINGSNPVAVTEESFTSDIFQQSGYYVGVTAKGDNRNFVDSQVGAYRNRIPLKSGELMAFNDPNYELDVTEAVNVGINKAPDEIKWLSEEECKGSTGGAVKLQMRSGAYGWGVFKVLMPEGTKLDMNDDSWNNMEIRFKVDSESYQASSKFLLNNPNGHNNDPSRGVTITKDNNDEWYIIQLPWNVIFAEGYKKYQLIPSATYEFKDNVVTWDKNVNAYGYQITVTKTAPDENQTITSKTYKNFSNDNGFEVTSDLNSYSYDITTDTSFYTAEEGYTYSVKVECEIPTSYSNLNFNLYDLIRTTGKGYVYLDYVRLYSSKISAPANFRYENGKILWDAVDGADKYTLNLVTTDEFGEDSTFYTIAGDKTEFDLVAAGIDTTKVKFTAEIRTIPTDTDKGSSDWAKFEQVLQPVGLSIDGEGVLSWTAVENADKYVVSVNGKEYQTDTTTLNIASEISKGDVVTYVKAIAKAGYLDGEFSVPCCKFKIEGSQIATFNSAPYENLITPLAKKEQGSTAVGKIDLVNYVDANTATGSDGALNVVISNVAGLGERQRDFKISFANALDFTGYDGISIRLKVYDISTYSYPSTPDVRFRMLNKGGSNYWGTDLYAKPITVGEWVTVRYTKTEVENCLINDGTALSLQIVGYGTFPGLAGGLLKFYLDDISYYKQLTTPTGFALNGNTISWNEVADADGYVVNVNGTDLPQITATSFDISDYTNADYAVKVKAVSSLHLESKYTEVIGKIVTSGINIATFNSTLYENTVKVLLDNTIQPWNGGAIDYTTISPKVEYQTGVDGADGGDALFIQPIVAHYGSGGGARHAVFTVKLPRALDLSGTTYTGIAVRFKALDVVPGLNGGGTDTDTIDIIQLANPTTKDATYTSYYNNNSYAYPYLEITEGSWVEWTLTVDQLKTLYSDGATELVFALVVKGSASYNYANPANTYLDYIKYVSAN